MQRWIIKATCGLILCGLILCAACITAKTRADLDLGVNDNKVASDNQVDLSELDRIVDAHTEQKVDAPLEVEAEDIQCLTQTIREQFLEQNSKVENAVQKLETLNQSVRTQFLDKLELFQQHQQAGTIHNSGAGWTLLTAVAMMALFTGALILVGWLIFRRLAHWKGLLKLVTGAIQQCEPEVCEAVKGRIEHETSNGGPFGRKHKAALASFAKKAGTFAAKQILQ